MDELFVKAFIYLAAQITDVYVNHIRPAFIVEIPKIIFYHLPREHYTAVSDHVLEQGKLLRCQLYGLSRADYRPGRSVDCQVRYGILVGLVPGILACHYLDHGAELIKAERLGKIVIASGTKAGNLVSYAVSCGKKEHRRNAPLGP